MNLRQRLELFVSDPIAFFSMGETRAEIEQTSGVGQATTRFFLSFKIDEVPTAIKQYVGGIGSIVEAYTGLFSIVELVASVRKAITAVNPFSRIKAVFKALVASSEIVSFVASIAQIPLVGQVLFPFSIVAGGLTAHKTYRNVKFYEEMRGKVKHISDKVDEIERRTVVLEAARFVAANSIKIEKKLGIDQEARIQEKAQAILQSGDIKKGEGFMHILRDRVHCKLGLDIATIAVRIAGIIAAGLLLFLPNPLTLGIALAVALVGFSLLIANRVTSEVVFNQLRAA